MESGLEGLCVWVTGASGTLGFEVARLAADEGARLLLQAGRRGADLAERAARLAPTDRVHVVAADVTDVAALEAAALQGVRRFGRIDALVHCAGVWDAEAAPLDRADPERLRRIVEVDLLGAMFTARAFLRRQASAPRSSAPPAIVFVGSTAGRFGEEGHAAYAAAKAGLRGLALSLKNEIVRLHPRGRVNVLEPGWFPSRLTLEALSDRALVKRIGATRAIRDLPSAPDVARAALLLASPACFGFTSGECIEVAGGMEGRLLWPPPDGAQREPSDEERA